MRKNLFPSVMKGLALAFGIGTAVLFWCSGFSARGVLGSLAVTALTCFYHFAMRLAVGALMPDKWNTESKRFRPRPWEAGLYKKLEIRKWKRFVPTYDPDSFNLEKHTPREVLQEMCRSEAVHGAIAVLSFVPIGFSLVFGELAVFVCTSLAAAGVDMIFVMLQRYNRPRVEKLLQRKSK